MFDFDACILYLIIYKIRYTVYVLHKWFFSTTGMQKIRLSSKMSCYRFTLGVLIIDDVKASGIGMLTRNNDHTLDCQVAALKKNSRMVIFNYTYMDPNATWEGTWPPKSTPKYFLRNHIWNEAKPAENLAWTSGNRWDPSMGWQLHTSATLRLNGFGPPQSIQKGMLSRKSPAWAYGISFQYLSALVCDSVCDDWFPIGLYLWDAVKRTPKDVWRWMHGEALRGEAWVRETPRERGDAAHSSEHGFVSQTTTGWFCESLKWFSAAISRAYIYIYICIYAVCMCIYIYNCI